MPACKHFLDSARAGDQILAMTALEKRLAEKAKREPIRILYSDDRIQVTERNGLVIQRNKIRSPFETVLLFKRPLPET